MAKQITYSGDARAATRPGVKGAAAAKGFLAMKSGSLAAATEVERRERSAKPAPKRPGRPSKT